MAPPRQIRQGLSDVAVIAGAAAGREITTHGFLGSFPTVAHHLVDRALVVMDGLHHAFKDGVENLSGLLRVAVGEQFHRPLEVGEQHRDLLALAPRALLEVRIFSARCFGVYDSGEV